MEKFEDEIILEDEEKFELPSQYSVIFYNDDFTTMDFVVYVLINIFNHSEEEAIAIMQNVHQKGSGIAGTYFFDIAQSKADQARTLAKLNEFPLQIKVVKA